jgi:hypothetical protein
VAYGNIGVPTLQAMILNGQHTVLKLPCLRDAMTVSFEWAACFTAFFGNLAKISTTILAHA